MKINHRSKYKHIDPTDVHNVKTLIHNLALDWAIIRWVVTHACSLGSLNSHDPTMLLPTTTPCPVKSQQTSGLSLIPCRHSFTHLTPHHLSSFWVYPLFSSWCSLCTALSLVVWKGKVLKIVGYQNLGLEPLLNEDGTSPNVCMLCVSVNLFVSSVSLSMFLSLSLSSSFPLKRCVGRWVGADVHIQQGRCCSSHLICATSLLLLLLLLLLVGNCVPTPLQLSQVTVTLHFAELDP